MDESIEKFAAEAEKGLTDGTFSKLILSNYKGPDRGLQKILVRLVDTKKGPRMMFQSRFETRDVAKNFDFEEGFEQLRRHLASGFRNAHLFTTTADLQLKIGKRNSHLTTGRASATRGGASAHNRRKKTLIDTNAFYLKALGIADDNGRIKPSQQDKWRQITKFVEILAGLLEASQIRDKDELRIVDMGSGKGYLTFATYDYFANVRRGENASVNERGSVAGAVGTLLYSHVSARKISMTGVEARSELVSLCNDIAQAGGFDGLNFIQGQIAEIDPGEIDILIALHACDTATDDALFKGLSAGASIIVAAPCCHKELRPQIKPPDVLAGILKHGIMLERTAETLTDGLRSLLLEREGYATKLFEFVPTEHTPKNNMLTAVRQSIGRRSESAARQIEEIKSQFRIASQRLESLLREI